MVFDLLLVYFNTFRDRSPLALTWYSEQLLIIEINSVLCFPESSWLMAEFSIKFPDVLISPQRTKFMVMKSNQLIAVKSPVM